jgi:hypothetical protein
MIDLTGQKFGKLTVLGLDRMEKRSYWKCICDCGTEKIVPVHRLKNGETKSCGCLHVTADLTGRRFGSWTVLGFSVYMKGQNYWKCTCDCGNEAVVRASNLKDGSSTACASHNITGKTFGYLTVLRKSNKKTPRGTYWVCECICGNNTTVRTTHLTDGHTRSGGCLHNKENYVDGTCIPLIRSKKIWGSNSSGVRGVCWVRRDKSWDARIWFKGKCYHLGQHKNIKDAASIRKQAEERLFGEFLEWYDGKFPKKPLIKDVVMQ